MTKTWSLSEAIKRTGVLKEGHFLLSSGRHSARYMQCAQLLQHPQEAEAVGQALSDLFKDQKIDLVVGPALGGVIIAHEVARALGVRCLFTERKAGTMELRRGFTIQPGERVLVIEDVVTTGGSVKEVIKVLEGLGAEIVAIGSMVNRNQGQNPFQYPYQALTEIHIESYTPEECPLCQQGIPVIKPGSRSTLKEA
ncbi:orotate phosphoribosyltransferase [Thermoflavimicrobium daqui]|jgi:orotate phosphoribosyltransferase|nr:orotate phosphoribosyltransferase [Thermoflavimicrobium daqui]